MATQRNDTRFGDTQAYVNAFDKVQQKGIPEKIIKALQEHYNSADRTISWKTLAEKIGYTSGDVVNMQYGAFAHRIADELGVPMPEENFWLYVLVEWADQRDHRGHTQFRLRKPFVEALVQLGIVDGGGEDSASGDSL